MLDRGAAEGDVKDLLATADAEQRQVGVMGRPAGGEFEGGAPGLGDDGGMALVDAEQGRVHIEGAAGHQQPVEAVEIGGDLVRLMGPRHRQANSHIHRNVYDGANRGRG